MQNHNREGNVLCHAINENRFIALRVDGRPLVLSEGSNLVYGQKVSSVTESKLAFAVRFQVVCSERILTPCK